MATYTATETKALTSVPKVNTWEDVKINKYVNLAESAIDALEMDSTVEGYSDAYSNAVLLMFDFFAENPTGKIKSSLGKPSAAYATGLPMSVQLVVDRYILGSDGGFLAGATVQRNDIGTR